MAISPPGGSASVEAGVSGGIGVVRAQGPGVVNAIQGGRAGS